MRARAGVRLRAPHPSPLPIRCGEGEDSAPLALFCGQDSGSDFEFQVASSWRRVFGEHGQYADLGPSGKVIVGGFGFARLRAA